MTIEHKEENHTRGTSVTSKSSRKRRNVKKKRARQWTYNVNTLKGTIDVLYEVCRTEQSVNGCKEALIYLNQATKDFESLIDTIKLEANWDNKDNKKSGCAWEVRKTTSSPTPLLQEKMIEQLPISPVVIAEVVLKKPEIRTDWQWDGWNQTANPMDTRGEDGWQVVRSKRRRSSVSSTTTTELLEREEKEMMVMNESCSSAVVLAGTSRMSVYDRLSGGQGRCSRRHSQLGHPGVGDDNGVTSSLSRAKSSTNISSRLKAPRSAMDLPQTRASMAKMAYSRQRLWEQTRDVYEEKLKARRRKEYSSSIRRGPMTSRLNFADPAALRKAGAEMQAAQRQRREKSAPVSEVNRSLESIREAAAEVDDTAGEMVPADPKPSNDPPDLPVPGTSSIAQPTSSEHHQQREKKNSAIRSIKSEPVELLSRAAADDLDMDDDVEWREMTEEEESLALEVQSLNAEIEQTESMTFEQTLDQDGIDDELAQSGSSFGPPKLFYAFKKWEEELQEFATCSWSDLMEKEFHLKCHQMGSVAEKHDRMNSPSRRRCEKNDVDYPQKHEQRIRKADEKREEAMRSKQERLRELEIRRAEIRDQQEKLKNRQRAHLEQKMEKAQENRERSLGQIVRKAKDDEQKVLEAQFINNVQGGNMRCDLRWRDAGVEERKQNLADERARKNEEKAAKEHAAEERRRVADEARQTRMLEALAHKEARHTQIAAAKSERERERQVKRRNEKEKADSVSRISDDSTSKLKKIQDRLDCGIRRHEESLEVVRARAVASRGDSRTRRLAALSDPSNWPSTEPLQKAVQCQVCNVICSSEQEVMAHVTFGSHLRNAKIEGNIDCDLLEQEMETVLSNEVDNRILETEDTAPDTSCTDSAILMDSLSSCPTFVPSAAKLKCMKDVNVIFERWNYDGRISDSLLKSTEKTITDVIRVSNDKTADKDIYEQLLPCAPKCLAALLRWTDSGAGLRLLLKMSSLICNASKGSSSFATVILCSGSTSVQLWSTVCRLMKDESSSPQLAALLDVCVAIVTSLRSSTSKQQQQLDLLAGFISRRDWCGSVEAVVQARVPFTVFNRIHLLTMALSQTSDKNSELLLVEYCRTVITLALFETRHGDGKGDMVKVAVEVSDYVAEKGETWQILCSNAVTKLMLILLLSDVIRNGVKSLHETNLMTIQQASPKKVAFSFDSNVLHVAINLASMLASNDRVVQVILCGGCRVVHWVSSLPCQYLFMDELRSLLCGSLIAMTFGYDEGAGMVAKELSLKHIVRYIQVCLDNDKFGLILEQFVPRNQWTDLIAYYQRMIDSSEHN